MSNRGLKFVKCDILIKTLPGTPRRRHPENGSARGANGAFQSDASPGSVLSTMSTQQAVPTTVVCRYAECQQGRGGLRKRGPKGEFHHGKYCCSEHAHRAAGSEIVAAIRKDHTVCSTCYRVRKRVEKPPEYYTRKWSAVIEAAVVGFEYPTADLHIEGGNQYCTCGNVDHYADNGFIKTSDLKATLVNLLAVLAQYREEPDKPSAHVDTDELLSTLKDQAGEQPLDWELAIGAAREDP